MVAKPGTSGNSCRLVFDVGLYRSINRATSSLPQSWATLSFSRRGSERIRAVCVSAKYWSGTCLTLEVRAGLAELADAPDQIFGGRMIQETP